MIRLGHAEEVWPLLRHSADPRLRSYIVNGLSPLGADPQVLATELARIGTRSKPTPAEGQSVMDAILFHPETSMRRALILALGTYGREGLSPGEREPLIAKLLDLYETDPDAGIHGAAAWTLRRWGQQAKLREWDMSEEIDHAVDTLALGQQAKLREQDQRLAGQGPERAAVVR